MTGRIISINAPDQSALVDGDLIPGFMDPMAMPYKVKPASVLNQLKPGDSISAELVNLESGDDNARPDYWIENVKVTGHVETPQAAAANALHVPTPGEDVPDFGFTNQSGKHISLKQYRDLLGQLARLHLACPQ